jgi:ATP-dependent helicase HrpA
MEQKSAFDGRNLERRIRSAMGADRYRLRTRLRQVEDAARNRKPFDKNLIRLEEELQRSVDLRATRVQDVPRIEFDPGLPVSGRREEIAKVIRDNQVVVICGETGSGKSTQIPKICLELGRGIDGLIAHTQPRRIAARSVAARIADELQSPLGKAVGFKIRFNDTTSPGSYIKLMTDGILLAELQGDRFLNQYDTIIIDEAHERSLNIDLLIGYVKKLLPKRRDLKLIITSATIDAERFAEHFANTAGPAPIVSVTGRTYPVEVRYRPLTSDEDNRDPDWNRAVVSAVEEVCYEERGDILIFMPTEHDIHETAKLLRGRMLPGDYPGTQTEILPLYARLAGVDQNRIFSTHKHRRIVIATNVAESSLTVPGIRYVIDPGTARISRYSAKSKLQRLPIESISQASADQRMGRCGRVGPGVCVRLFSAEDYSTRDRFTPPEIQRTNLASVILQIKSLNLGEIEDFPFLDPPRTDAIRDGYKTLFEIGALTEKNELTDIGRQLSRIPVDPRIGRIVLASDTENCLAEILIIASALELQDPRERPIDKQQAADECHAQFANEDSDFLSYLNLWDFFHKLRDDLSKSRLRDACKQNFLSFNRLREWQDLHRQLHEVVQQVGMKTRSRQNDFGAIHRALLIGLLSNVSQKGETSEYTVGGGGKMQLWPGSGVFGKKPKWVVAAEQIETSKKFLRTAARIDPAWIEPLAQHLTNRSYSEPHWDEKMATVMAYEKVSLFGLVVTPRRRVKYSHVEPVLCREMFIHHALVLGEFETRGKFLQHNHELIERLESLQIKARRRDLILPEQVRFEFFDKLIPPGVCDAIWFEKWRKEAERQNPQILFLKEEDLIEPEVDPVSDAQFPDTLPMRNLRLPLEYRFDPGSDTDGLTLIVPQEGINQIDPQRLGWLVPGLLEEKITAVIKGLPKDLRRAFVPIPETAREVFKRVQFGEGSFSAAVVRVLESISGDRIPREAIESSDVPSHLQMHIKVVAPDGKQLAIGPDLKTVQAQLGADAAALFTTIADDRWQKDGITQWDFGELPDSVPLSRNGLKMTGYPALSDQGDTVSLRLLDTEERATAETHNGLRRMFVLALGRDLKAQIDWLPNFSQLKLYAMTLPDAAVFRPQLMDLLADRAFYATHCRPHHGDEFMAAVKAGKQRIGLAVQDLIQLLPPMLQHYQEIRLAIETMHGAAFQIVRADLKSQLDHLVAPGFLTQTPWRWLSQYPRYLRSMLMRRSKLAGPGLARDQKLTGDISRAWRAYQDRAKLHAENEIVDPELIQFRWMLEEYRVSLFTQELGTSITVSPKRLDEQWAKVRKA